MDWTHDALQRDLAAHLASPGWMIWEDIQLGPAGSPRPDVYTLTKSFARPRALAYEVKVSRSDFRADATTAKWMAYLQFAQGVSFAVPKGLVAKEDIPPQAGLVVRGDTGWRTLRRPTLSGALPGFTEMMKLVIDGVKRERSVSQTWRWDTYTAMRRMRQTLGEDVTLAVRDLQAARQKIALCEQQCEDARKQAVTIRAEAQSMGRRAAAEERAQLDKALAEAREALELPETASTWEVCGALRSLRRDPNAKMRRALEDIQRLAAAAAAGA